MPAGRPTKLTKEVLLKTQDYLDNYESYDDVVPSKAGLACALNVSKSTIKLWDAKDDTEHQAKFSALCEKIKAKQEKALCSGGLKGDFNATITKLMLTKHGYSDKQDVNADITAQITGVELTPI